MSCSGLGTDNNSIVVPSLLSSISSDTKGTGSMMLWAPAEQHANKALLVRLKL